MKKASIFKSLIFGGIALLTTLSLGFASVNADSIYGDITELSETLDSEATYTLEEMLIYALQSEYLAKAEYELLIESFGEIKPFIHIVKAEQTHIDLLIDLFIAYGYEIPEDLSSTIIALPESVSSAIATGIDAEKASIAMYETFLATEGLPEDVQNTFEYLKSASERHLQAFSKDRFSGLGNDLSQGLRKMFQNKSQQGKMNQHRFNQFGTNR
jgi:hypothetical protein